MMDLVYFTLWFMVVVVMIWDTRRTHLQSQTIMRDVAASVERIEANGERIGLPAASTVMPSMT